MPGGPSPPTCGVCIRGSSRWASACITPPGVTVEALLRDAAAARRALAAPGGLERFRPSEAPRAVLSGHHEG
jgi:hypothetical protein